MKDDQVERDSLASRDPRNLNALLEEVRGTLRRFIVLGDSEAVAITLFVAHTWAFEGSYATPYILVLSPEKRSGKSRLLEVLELLCARPWRVSGSSEAAMFRKLANDKPTLLLDEIDAVFGADSQRTEPLRAILNSGNRQGGSVARCVGPQGERVVDFEVFSPKVLAGIDTGRLPDTIRDRSIPIAMKRRTPNEQVERLHRRIVEPELDGLRTAMEGWAEAANETLQDANPYVPEALDDRAAEAWEPLLAIADLVGDDWPERAREAARALSTAEETETSRNALLLGAIRDAFEGREKIPSAVLCKEINRNEELPFGGWNNGNGLNPRELARLLKPYGVGPKTIRIDDEPTAKGYVRNDFLEVWERWLPQPQKPSQPSQPSQPTKLSGTSVTDVTHVTDTAGTSSTAIDQGQGEPGHQVRVNGRARFRRGEGGSRQAKPSDPIGGSR
jgi:hypothetical protein